MNRVIRWIGSLQIAVPLLLAIAVVLGWGTIYEARYGTAAVQRFVYHSWWFQALLAFLAVNLTVSALERYPWRRKHAPFLLAHLGIMLILAGGIIGGRFGIDGQLIIPEGQAEQTLQLSKNLLVVRQPNPGVTHVFPTHFETTAWIRRPQTTFRVLGHHGWLVLTVDRYYPDAEAQERISDGGPADNPAVELALGSGEQQERVWLLARDPERFGARWGDLHVLFMQPKTAGEWAGLVGLPQPKGSSRGVITVDLPDLNVRQDIPVPDDFSRPVAVAGTPYAVTFKQYFTDLAVTGAGVVNRSTALKNPAIALTLTGPEGTEPFLAFALHPDFEALHGQSRAIPARVSYRQGGTHLAWPPGSIILAQHPTGELSCVLTGPAGERYVAACGVGGPYTHPWTDTQFQIVHDYSRAEIHTEFVSRGDEVKAQALHVRAQDGPRTAEGWVGLNGAVELSLGGTAPVRVEYRPAQWELPVSIKLLDFRKTNYPGTEMAAAFESDVELSDPQRGVILMRTIRMNQPLRYRGFSFYQASYIAGDPETTVLAVRKDPGTPFVYAGFIIVMLGVIGLFVLRDPSATAAMEEKAST